MDLSRVDHDRPTSLPYRMKGLDFWVRADQWVSVIILLYSGHLDGWMDGWMDRWMDGWMDKDMDMNWDRR